MTKPYSLLLYLLAIITFFLIGVSFASLINAGNGQMLAGGAIVLGYGVISCFIGLCIALIISFKAGRKAILRINLLLTVLIIALGSYFYIKYQNRDDQKSEFKIIENDHFKSPESFGLLKNSNDVMMTKDLNGSKYTYGEVTIVIESHSSYNGDIVTVFHNLNSQTIQIGEEYSCFFKGLANDLIIIDTGTGQARGLEIYSTDGELVFDAEYLNELKIEGNDLIFWSSVETESVSVMPNCYRANQDSDFTIGLINKNMYNLQTRKLTNTNEIDCQFFE